MTEIPSNWLLSKVAKPSLFLGSMIISWGIVMTLSGVVQNFAGLCVTRLFLGFFEYYSECAAIVLSLLTNIKSWVLPWSDISRCESWE